MIGLVIGLFAGVVLGVLVMCTLLVSRERT